MPFYPNPPVVASHVNAATLPKITDQEKKELPPSASRSLILKGGAGGDIGEKSKPAELYYSEIDLTDNIGNLTFSQDQNVNIDEVIKSTKENDCGYAIQCLQDGSNACTLNINLYSQIPSVDIYSRSNFFNYGGLLSGISNNGSQIFNNGSFADFTVKLKDSNVTPGFDSDFGLNRYYISLKNGTATPNSEVFLGRQLNLANLNNLFCFHVVELDYLSDYTAYLTADAIYDAVGGGTLNLNGISTNDFENGDVLKILSEKNIYGAIGYYNSSTSKLDVSKWFNSEASDFYTNVGERSAATIGLGSNLDDPKNIFQLLSSSPTLKFCMFAKDFQNSFFNNNTDSYFTEGGNDNYYNLGLHLKINKQVTNTNKEISNTLSFQTDNFGLYKGETYDGSINAIINQTVERIRERSYITNQYGTDANKLAIKNKPKFCLIFHGIIKVSDGWKYYCGTDGGIIADIDLKGVANPFFDNSTPYLLLGNPFAKNNAGATRAYHEVKLYETLIYKNLTFDTTYNPIDLIRVNLINKYKQKMFMNASVELTASDIYYTYVDRLNILGKMKKT